MSAGRHDFTIEQGASWTRTLKVSKAGVPINLTGYTARMHIRRQAGSPTALAQLSTEDGSIEIEGVSGTLVLRLTAIQTAALVWDRAVYDLELVSGAEVTRLLEGSVSISPEVTR